jgi:hypothetical protein
MRIDSTVIAADSRYPTDAGLASHWRVDGRRQRSHGIAD